MHNIKTALVTGGGRRIGAAITRGLHANGYNVIIHYGQSVDQATKLMQQLNDERAGSVSILQADLAKVDSVRALAKQSLHEFGPLDLLINNASAFFPTPLANATDADWQNLHAVNLRAPFLLCQELAKSLEETKGSIINITDIYADRPLPGYSIYSASKAGLLSLSRSLALELAPGVRVNAVAPGAILWPQNSSPDSTILSRIPLQRCGEERDIVETVLFLADRANYVTGQVINVDGGRSINP
jgi:pteridine reductase